MNKLDHYYNLPYPITIEPCEGVWFASYPDLPGSHAEGRTEEEALEKLKGRKRIWLESALATNCKINEPREEVR